MRNFLLPILILSLCLGGKLCFQHRHWVERHEISHLPPLLAQYRSDSVERYSFGFNNLLGAAMWVQLLQKGNEQPIPHGKLSWEYSQFDTITTLDPNNMRVYEFGAIFISTLRRDQMGGKHLLEKWTHKQPDYWRVWYMLGNHEYSQLRDYPSAAPHILKASLMANAPTWLSSLGVRLLSETGQLYAALKASLELYQQLPSEESKARLVDRIRSLNYNIQKQRWISALQHFKQQYGISPPSIDALRTLAESQSRELSSLLEGQDKKEIAQRLLQERFDFKWDPETQNILSAHPKQTELLENAGIHIPPHLKEAKP